MSKTNWIAESFNADNVDLSNIWAGVRKARNGQYELCVRGGYPSRSDCAERRYRADDLDDLLRIGVSEVRQDDELQDCESDLVAAIRDVIFDAQDCDDSIIDLYDIAKDRLENLGLNVELVDDASGQTTAEDHLKWLLSAADDDIRKWADEMSR